MRKLSSALALCLLSACAQFEQPPQSSSGKADAAFNELTDEYLAGYLAWRPQTGTSLGFHQYDGKVTDYSQGSLAAELARLKSFEYKLAKLEPNTLRPGAAHDYRLLL